MLVLEDGEQSLLLKATAPEQYGGQASGKLSRQLGDSVLHGSVTGAELHRTARGTFDDWHRAPRRQYVIKLSGRGEIEVAGGKKISVGPGSIDLVEDTTSKGHHHKSGEDGGSSDSSASSIRPVRSLDLGAGWPRGSLTTLAGRFVSHSWALVRS